MHQKKQLILREMRYQIILMETDKLWKDDDRIEIVIDDIMKNATEDVPLVCPVCGEKQVHYYMYK